MAKENSMEKTILNYMDEIHDACNELRKARFAVSEIINEFDVSYELSPYKRLHMGAQLMLRKNIKMIHPTIIHGNIVESMRN